VGALQRVYFDLVYNPLYDATTARFSRYKTLQQKCIKALDLEEARSLLCVGLGTGNELVAALQAAPHLGVCDEPGTGGAASALRHSAGGRLRGRTLILRAVCLPPPLRSVTDHMIPLGPLSTLGRATAPPAAG